MHFLHSPLTWAFFLVLVPLLIHLINMMRHKRVKWAAMEFLLASYKKHRKWIWLKQLLLLLSRMAAVAAVVAIMAQLVPPDKWAHLFGGRVTHHYVLLDDSFSMSDTTGGRQVFDEAKTVLQRIVDRALAEETRQKLTVIRYSSAATGGEESSAATIARPNAATVAAGEFKEDLDAMLRPLKPTQLAVGPSAALSLLSRLLEDDADESRVVYVLSDFRQREWGNPTEVDQRLATIADRADELRLVSCTTQQRPNLAITSLRPAEGARSAGVPLFVKVTVKNLGADPAENVKVGVTSYYYDSYNPARHADDPAQIEPEQLDERTELIKRLEPGDSETRQVQVFFPGPGKHVVEATLPEDAVAADNRRYTVIDFAEGEPVLIVDGNPSRRNAYYLAAAFQPAIQGTAIDGERTVRTGISPTVESPVKLRDMPLDELRRYHAVYLLDVDSLDDSAINKLETFARDGGGVAIFLGSLVDPNAYNNKLYRDGDGLMPVKLGRMEPLVPLEESDEPTPDFDFDDHPVLEFFTRGGLTLRRSLLIDAFYQSELPDSEGRGVSGERRGEAGDELQQAPVVLARYRDPDRSPFIVERQFGRGRVMLFTTTVAPDWNNWARSQGGGPSFVGTMLLLHGYLAAPQRSDAAVLVGSPLGVELDPQKYQQSARWIVPSVKPLGRKPISITATEAKSRDDDQTDVLKVSLGESTQSGGVAAATGKQGVYEAWSETKSAALEVQRFALNVDSDEGDLAYVSANELEQRLSADVEVNTAADSDINAASASAGSWSQYILYGLIVLLLIEQLLAFSASYHPAPAAGGVR